MQVSVWPGDSEMSSGRKDGVLTSFLLVVEIGEELPVLCVGSSGTMFNVVLTT